MFWCFKASVLILMHSQQGVSKFSFRTMSIFLPLASLAEFTLDTFRSMLKTKIFCSQNLRTSTDNSYCTTSNTPTYDIQSLRHNHQQINTLAHHQTTSTQPSSKTTSTQPSSKTHRIHQTINNSRHHHISMDIQRHFRGFRGVY
jgi:hypothetical protein